MDGDKFGEQLIPCHFPFHWSDFVCKRSEGPFRMLGYTMNNKFYVFV